MSDRCLPRTVGIWEGRVDGVESILKQGVRHIGGATIRRDNADALQRDDLRRWDNISSLIPVRRSEALCCSYPSWIRVLLGNVKCIPLQQLLYDSINIVVV